MRDLASKPQILEFMRLFGHAADKETRVYFTGGTTAVLKGWRETTVDIDLKFDPELDSLYRAIPKLKEQLKINVELAAPSDFIPAIPGWENRSLYIDRVGKASFYHYDPYGQALAKIERGHSKDLSDIESMVSASIVDPAKLLDLFKQIEADLYLYPAIDPGTFATAVHHFVEKFS